MRAVAGARGPLGARAVAAALALGLLVGCASGDGARDDPSGAPGAPVTRDAAGPPAVVAGLPLLAVSPTGTPLDLPPADPDAGRLLVLVRADASPLARRFLADDLPEIVGLARGLGVEPTLLDVSAAAPDGATLTPQLVYQNHRGRSVFEGRYASLDRLRNFLRTARRAPLGEARLEQTRVPALRLGRATLTAPLKLGDLTGEVPRDHDADAFRQEAEAAVLAGFERFRLEDAVTTGRGDRAFYMDVYPYRDGDTLYVSTALYSQFHCKQPVFRTPPDAPFTGGWDDRARLFARAARGLEAAVLAQLADPTRGDGFDALPAGHPTVAWDALGLALPEAPEDAERPAPLGAIPTAWVLGRGTSADVAARTGAPAAAARPTPDASSGGPMSSTATSTPAAPSLLFHLEAPLDSYRGEVTGLSGALTLGDAPSGEVVVDPTTVSLGDPDLDRWVHGPAVLDIAAHPTARFDLLSLTLDAPLGWGRLSPARGAGTFTMRGERVPLEVRVELEPVAGPDGAPRLLATGAFGLDLGPPWSVDVPVGDPPRNRRLVLDFAFELAPADG